jgi:hypothetical protein
MTTKVVQIHPSGHPRVVRNIVEFTEGIEITNGSGTSTPGSLSFDSDISCLNVQNTFTGSVLQVGQETVAFVCNRSGSDMVAGQLVYLDGYDATCDTHKVLLSQADSIDNATVDGMLTVDIADGANGLMTRFGRINELDTSVETPGDPVYLSDTIAGAWTTSRPSVAIQVGKIGRSDVSNGYIMIDTHTQIPSIAISVYNDSDVSFTPGTPISIPFNQEYSKIGMGHSNTVNPEEIQIVSSGNYLITGGMEILRTKGASSQDVYLWLQRKPSGGSFTNVPHTTIRQSVYNKDETARITAIVTVPLDAGDIIKVMADATTTDLILDARAAGANFPEQPSAMFSIVRLGNQ